MSFKTLLKTESSSYSQDFLLALQSFYLLPTIDKPTRVRSNSESLIENIFVNNPDLVLISGNIITDVSDHFSQFCILKSNRDKLVKKIIKNATSLNFPLRNLIMICPRSTGMILLPQKQIILMTRSHLSTESWIQSWINMRLLKFYLNVKLNNLQNRG